MTNLIVDTDTGRVLVTLKADLLSLSPSSFEVFPGKFFDLPT